jgi:hypothetical protein
MVLLARRDEEQGVDLAVEEVVDRPAGTRRGLRGIDGSRSASRPTCRWCRDCAGRVHGSAELSHRRFGTRTAQGGNRAFHLMPVEPAQDADHRGVGDSGGVEERREKPSGLAAPVRGDLGIAFAGRIRPREGASGLANLPVARRCVASSTFLTGSPCRRYVRRSLRQPA